MTLPQPGARFGRRIYTGPMQFVRDLRRILGSWRPVLELSSKRGISAGFRERIMLAVTGVNRCRHCAYGHEFFARRAGVPTAEIRALLAQDLSGAPEHEIAGLAFAVHWAETDASPATDARIALEACYGPAVSRQIEAAALMIHIGNRVGNSFDYLLSRISGGRFGLLAAERRVDPA